VGFTFGKTDTERLKLDVTPVTGMASRANGLFTVGLVLGLLGAGLIGFLWGAVFSPVTITKTTKLIITRTSYLTYTKTVKGDMADYIMALDLAGQLYTAMIYDLTPYMQKHSKGEISDQYMAEKLENSTKMIDKMIEILLKNPPPEKEIDRYKKTLENLLKLKLAHQLLAKGLKENNLILKAQAAQLALEASKNLQFLLL